VLKKKEIYNNKATLPINPKAKAPNPMFLEAPDFGVTEAEAVVVAAAGEEVLEAVVVAAADEELVVDENVTFEGSMVPQFDFMQRAWLAALLVLAATHSFWISTQTNVGMVLRYLAS